MNLLSKRNLFLSTTLIFLIPVAAWGQASYTLQYTLVTSIGSTPSNTPTGSASAMVTGDTTLSSTNGKNGGTYNYTSATGAPYTATWNTSGSLGENAKTTSTDKGSISLTITNTGTVPLTATLNGANTPTSLNNDVYLPGVLAEATWFDRANPEGVTIASSNQFTTRLVSDPNYLKNGERNYSFTYVIPVGGYVTLETNGEACFIPSTISGAPVETGSYSTTATVAISPTGQYGPTGLSQTYSIEYAVTGAIDNHPYGTFLSSVAATAINPLLQAYGAYATTSYLTQGQGLMSTTLTNSGSAGSSTSSATNGTLACEILNTGIDPLPISLSGTEIVPSVGRQDDSVQVNVNGGPSTTIFPSKNNPNITWSYSLASGSTLDITLTGRCYDSTGPTGNVIALGSYNTTLNLTVGK